MDPDALDVVVGCVSGESFERITPWVVSLDACGFRGRRIMIYFRLDPQIIAELNRRGYETYDASYLHHAGIKILQKNPHDHDIVFNRFYYIWYFLSQSSLSRHIRYLMAIDVGDVIFQRNPSLWLEQNLHQKRIVVGCESLHFENEPWGAQKMQESFGPHVWQSYKRELIYNAGTIAGEYQAVVDLCLQLCFLSPVHRVRNSDQAALNLLLGSKAYRDMTCFASSDDGWACQAGTVADPKLLPKVRDHLTCAPPVFDGEFVRTAAGEIFTLVHQYNRVPEWHMPLKRKYGVASAKPASRKSRWSLPLFRGKRIWRY